MAQPTSAQKRAYNNKVYDYIQITVKKDDGGKERIKEAAELSGLSVNAYIIKAIYEKMQRDGINVSVNYESGESDE